MTTRSLWNVTTTALVLSLIWTAAAYGQGPTITGVGAVNRSMGGAGTAAPLDAIGALHWNPGSISALPTNEVSFGFEALIPQIELATNIGGATSVTRTESGFAPIPSVGWVHHVDGTPMTVGLGLYGIAGFRNNLPRNPANPILAAGPAYADAEVLQLAPTVAWALTDRLSIGISPTVTASKVTLLPLGPSVITPDPTAGSGNRTHWGGGVQLGIYFQATCDWSLGFTFKSRQWQEDFRFFTPDGVVKWDLDYPMILSLGTAYTGFDNWVLAMDVRMFNYDSTPGFNDLGFSNVFTAAFGAQYTWNECWKFRCGYNFNQDPLHSSDAITNVFTPLIQNQNVAAGVSRQFGEHVEVSLTYVYLVENDLTGPLPPQFGPGSTLTHTISAHSAALGVTVRY